MSNNGTLRDKDGYVYEKKGNNWYERKWDFFRQDYLRDNARLKNQPTFTTPDKVDLFEIQENTSEGTSSSSSISGVAFLVLLFLILTLVITLTRVIAALAPIVAPIVLTYTESMKKRGDIAKFNKMKSISAILSILALLVAGYFSARLGIGLFTYIVYQINNANLFVTVLIYLLAIILSPACSNLIFITGVSPTAIVYLRFKEAEYRKVENIILADRIRRLYLVIGGIAVTTISIVIFGSIVFFIFRAFSG